MMQKVPLFVIVILLYLSGCDQSGLNPNEYQEPGFSGSITFTGTIPPPSTLRDLRVVAVPYYPIDTLVSDFILKILSPVKIIAYSDDLSKNVSVETATQYQVFALPKTYYYIAVAQLFSEKIFEDWRVIGIYGYSENSPNPAPVVVVDGKMTKNINITVDFDHVPPQPFKK